LADDDAVLKPPERFKNDDDGSEAHLTKEVKPGLKAQGRHRLSIKRVTAADWF